MSDKSNKILEKAVKEGVPTFRDSFVNSGYNRSGESLRSIGSDANSITAHISVSTLVFGRHPGGKQPPSGYERGTQTPTSLMQWVMDVMGFPAKEAQGISFVIARKIKEYGNQVYQGKKQPVPVEPTIQKVSDSLFEMTNQEIRTILLGKKQ